MIVLSWVFLAAAIATLVIGVFSELVWVYVSIGASVLALIFLLAGILRRKPVQPATAGAPYGPSPEEAAARGRPAAAATATAPAPAPLAAPAPPAPPRRTAPEPVTETAPTAPPTEAPEEAPVAEAAVATAAESPAEPAPAAKKTTTRKTAAKKTTAKTPAKTSTAKTSAAKKTAAAGTSTRTSVIAIPERGTFHKSTCRYVQGRDDTERVQLGTAKNRGYTACKVCKPESS